LPWRRHHAEGSAAPLGITLLAAIFGVADADARALIRLWVDQHDVGDADWHLSRQAAALWALLALFHVLVDAVDALDDDLADLVVDTEHLAARALIVAANHLDHVALANVHD